MRARGQCLQAASSLKTVVRERVDYQLHACRYRFEISIGTRSCGTPPGRPPVDPTLPGTHRAGPMTPFADQNARKRENGSFPGTAALGHPVRHSVPVEQDEVDTDSRYASVLDHNVGVYKRPTFDHRTVSFPELSSP